MDFVYAETERVLKRYGTRNPFELLDAIGAVTKISNEYSPDGLKGYCTILNRISYAVINGNLSRADMSVAAGHEAAHLILHRSDIMNSPIKSMRDFNLYDNSGHVEREANFFLADFIISDEDVLETVGTDDDYFAAAKGLYIPAPLFAFKLYSMMRRGFAVRTPIDPDGRFLAR